MSAIDSHGSYTNLIEGWNYGFLILVIIIFAGIIGGLASYYLNESDDKSKIKSIVLGVAAAFIVPVLLNMISSNLLSDSQKRFDALFSFAGFCVLAAVFSRNFLENIYNKVLQQVGSINDKVKMMEQVTEEPDISDSERQSMGEVKGQLSEEDKTVLQSFANGRFAYRALPGLTKDSGLERSQVEQCLNKLMANQLVESKLNDKQQMRYFLSGKGRKLLGAMDD